MIRFTRGDATLPMSGRDKHDCGDCTKRDTTNRMKTIRHSQ